MYIWIQIIEFSNLLCQTYAVGFFTNSAHCELVSAATTLYTTVQKAQDTGYPDRISCYLQTIQVNAMRVSTYISPRPIPP
jgi:hypothetical protein